MLTKLAGGYKTTPVMAAGLADGVHDIRWLSDLLTDSKPRQGKRGPYRKTKQAS